MPTEPQLRLTKPLERVIREGHPWVYRDALDGQVQAGSIATLVDRKGRFLARGIAESGPIALRVWTTQDEAVGPDLLRARLLRAIALRDGLPLGDTTAWRVLNGEGDRTPGVVIDRYGTEDGVFGVLRLEGAASELPWIADTVEEVLPADGLLIKRGRGRALEHHSGKRTPEQIVIREHGMTLLADLWRGQKTGLFLDHRESRADVRALAKGRRTLNLYGYTGGFSVAAGLGGATRVTTVDLAAPAIELANQTWEHNGLPRESHQGVTADVRAFLDEHKDRWDLIIADPPSFAPNEKSKPAALLAYEALHAACLSRLARDGLYLAASCSSHVTHEDFLGTLRAGARRARIVLQVLERSGAPADHPRIASFPEGDYLKIVLVRRS